jgi:D-beta-D-heptose 7-phosphate kinase/D-beta-D-heptose 1-phosphate adenosyltransferase
MGQIVDRERLLVLRRTLGREGKRVVFTNGCFDLVHVGHIRFLRDARRCGDVLIVALNSDRSVRELKGPGRPLVPQDERCEIVAALEMVDYVTVFDEPTPRELIQMLLPDVLVKGGDWKIEEIVGREDVQAYGGQVLSLPYVPGHSTSEIIARVLATFSSLSR